MFQFSDPFCLQNCYPENNCINSLLNDYKNAGGVCKDELNDDNFNPGDWSISDKPCVREFNEATNVL